MDRLPNGNGASPQLEIQERRRFFQLAVGIWVAIAVGSNYAFGIVSNELKDRFSIGQAGMTTISTVGYMMGFFSLPGGVMQDFFGPRPTLTVGGTCGFVGFLLLALMFWEFIPNSIPLLSFSYGLICTANSWNDQGALVTNLYAFPINRGDVITLQKTFVGLGSSLLALWYSGFFEKQFAEYCLFAGFLEVVACVLGALFIQLPPYHLTNWQRRKRACTGIPADDACLLEWEELYSHKKPPRWRLRLAFISLLATFLVVTVTSVVRAFVALSSVGHILISMLSILCVLSFVMMFAAKEGSCFMRCLGGEEARDHKNYGNGADATAEAEGLATSSDDAELRTRNNLTCASASGSEATELVQVNHGETSSGSPPANNQGDCANLEPTLEEAAPSKSILESYYQFPNGFLKNLRSEPIVWMMWLWNLTAEATGIVVLGNTAQIYRAVNNNVFEEDFNAFCVAMLGIGSGIGRITAGQMDNFLRSRGWHCTIMMMGPPSAIGLSLAGFLFLPASASPVLFAIAALGFGMGQSLMLLSSRLMFRNDVSKHYSFCSTATVLGVVLFNRLLFGESYESESKAQGLYPFCSGVRCVSMPFGVLVGVSVIGVGFGFAVHRLWLKQHAKQHAKLVESR